MTNTEILILKTAERIVTEERKFGARLTIADDIEHALELVLQRHFDILIIDNEIPSLDKTRMKLLSSFHLNELIVLENNMDDKNFESAIAQGIRNKTLKNFGQFELHEKN